MSYWMKYFDDGTVEKGTDRGLSAGTASWVNGRLEGLNAAILHYAGTIIKVAGVGIWQKDQFTVGIDPSAMDPSRIARSLGLQVTKEDVGQSAYMHHEGHDVYTLSFAPLVRGNHIKITEDDIGSWLVAKISRVGTVGLLIEERYRV